MRKNLIHKVPYTSSGESNVIRDFKKVIFPHLWIYLPSLLKLQEKYATFEKEMRKNVHWVLNMGAKKLSSTFFLSSKMLIAS